MGTWLLAKGIFMVIFNQALSKKKGGAPSLSLFTRDIFFGGHGHPGSVPRPQGPEGAAHRLTSTRRKVRRLKKATRYAGASYTIITAKYVLLKITYFLKMTYLNSAVVLLLSIKHGILAPRRNLDQGSCS